MKKFKVCLTQDVTQSMVVEVMAKDEDEAHELGLAYYESEQYFEDGKKFEVDDGNPWEPPEVSWVEKEEPDDQSQVDLGFLLESMRVSLSDALAEANGQCPNLPNVRDHIRLAQSALGKVTIHAHRAGRLEPNETDKIKCTFERGGTHEEIELDASTVNGIVAGFDTAENVDGPSPSANWRRLCAALARISK